MLDKFETLLINNGYYYLRPLKDTDKCPCIDIDFKAIDFDLVKSKFHKKFVINGLLRSVDILMLIPEMDEIHFIESKTFEGDAGFFYEKYCHTHEIVEKNVHSIFIIMSIARTYNIDKDFYQYFFDFRSKLKVRTTIISNIPKHEQPMISILNLGSSGTNFHGILGGQIDIVDCETFKEKYESKIKNRI